MIAKEENGLITVYPDYPTDYRNILNFKLASIEIKEANGFYPVVQPILTDKQMCGVIYFDTPNKLFTYTVVLKPIQSAEELFNPQDFMNSLLVKFWGNVTSIDKLNTYINNCCQNRIQSDAPNVMRVGFAALNDYMQKKLALGYFTQSEFDVFYETMAEQTIDLSTYVLPK